MTDENAYLIRMAALLNRDPFRHAAGCFLLLLWVGVVWWKEGRLT